MAGPSRKPLRSMFDDDEITALLTDHGVGDVMVSGSDRWARVAGRRPLADPLSAERFVTAHR